MRLLPLIVAAILVGCGAARAQSAMTSAGIGATSPLGVLGSSASSGSNSATGIPLGATEIDPGGLSPAPVSNCNTSVSSSAGMSLGTAGSSGPGMASMSGTSSNTGMTSTFDGGGFQLDRIAIHVELRAADEYDVSWYGFAAFNPRNKLELHAEWRNDSAGLDRNQQRRRQPADHRSDVQQFDAVVRWLDHRQFWRRDGFRERRHDPTGLLKQNEGDTCARN